MAADRRDATLKVLVFLFLTMLMIVMAVVAYAYLLQKGQAAAIAKRETEISRLREAETAIQAQLEEKSKDEARIREANAALQADAARFEEEKNVILNQVKTAINNFESFRIDARNEIARLKTEIDALQADKAALESEVQNVVDLSAEERGHLQTEIADLSDKISNGQKMQKRLARQLDRHESVNISVETAKLHYNLGNFYFRNRDYTNAAREYEQALIYQPGDADIHFNAAVVYDDYIGHYDSAKAHYQKFLELRPDAAERKRVQQRILDINLRSKMDIDVPSKSGGKWTPTPNFALSNFALQGDKA